MDPHARAFAFYRRRTISDDLVVSDSEPESNLQSTTTKTTASTSQSQPRGRHTNRFSATRPILDIPDDSSRQLPRRGDDIFELFDEFQSEEEIEKSHILSTNRSQPPPPRAVATTGSRFSFGAPASDGVGSDSETKSIDFSQFAYSAQPSQPKSRAASQSSVRTTHSTSVLPEKPSNVRMIHSAADFHTDREIDLLSRCVACDMAWTTKKTVPRKRHHLRTCQKKNDLTDDTIRLRIERELAKAAEENPQKKGKSKAKEKSTSPNKHATLMNAVVHEALPKKRAKRKEKLSTIIGIEYQHETLQKHARSMLDLDSDEGDSSTPGLSATTSTTFPLTQEFPDSKFGSRKGFEMDLATSLPSPVTSDGDERKPISISSDSESRASEKYSPLSSRGNGRHRDLQNALRQSPASQNGEDEWMQDLQREIDTRESMAQWEDAGMLDIRHPETHITDLMWKGAMEDNAMGIDPVPTKKKGTRKPKAPLAKDTKTPVTPVKRRTATRPPSSTISSPVKRKADLNTGGMASPSKTQSRGALEARDQDRFNHLIQAAIMNDKALWQRVLRYEPVNFTEFLDIARAAGEPNKKLSDQLRVFLVSKAIQYFMPKTGKRR